MKTHGKTKVYSKTGRKATKDHNPQFPPNSIYLSGNCGLTDGPGLMLKPTLSKNINHTKESIEKASLYSKAPQKATKKHNPPFPINSPDLSGNLWVNEWIWVNTKADPFQKNQTYERNNRENRSIYKYIHIFINGLLWTSSSTKSKSNGIKCQPASKPAKSHEFVLGGLVYKPIEN